MDPDCGGEDGVESCPAGLVELSTQFPSGNGYYLWGFDRATNAFRRLMRMERGPPPEPSTSWVERGETLRINPNGTQSSVGWWYGQRPQG